MVNNESLDFPGKKKIAVFKIFHTFSAFVKMCKMATLESRLNRKGNWQKMAGVLTPSFERKLSR